MTRTLVITLTAEGTSDRWLLHPIEWILRGVVENEAVDVRTQFCTRDGPMDVASRIAFAAAKYPSDICFVHRDADRAGAVARRAEILRVAGDLHVVPCVPVVTSEAWLLLDASAIRKAADNPSGTMELNLPTPREVEHERTPKRRFASTMVVASGLRGRRRHAFERGAGQWPSLVGDYIESFARHREVQAFSRFAADTERAVRTVLAMTPGSHRAR